MERRDLEGALRDLESRLREVQLEAEGGFDRSRGLGRLRQLEDELARHRAAAPQAVLPGIENWVADQTQGELRALERELQRLEKRIGDERQGEQGAQQKCFEANEKLMEIGRLTPALKEEKRLANERIAEELAEFGTLTALAQQVRSASQRKLEAEQALELFLQRYAARVERPQS